MMTAVCDLFFAPKGIASGGGHGSSFSTLGLSAVNGAAGGVQRPAALSDQPVFLSAWPWDWCSLVRVLTRRKLQRLVMRNLTAWHVCHRNPAH